MFVSQLLYSYVPADGGGCSDMHIVYHCHCVQLEAEELPVSFLAQPFMQNDAVVAHDVLGDLCTD